MPTAATLVPEEFERQIVEALKEENVIEKALQGPSQLPTNARFPLPVLILSRMDGRNAPLYREQSHIRSEDYDGI